MPKTVKSRATVRAMIKNSIYVIIGSVILAIGVGLFVKPFSLVTGGVSGFSIALASYFRGLLMIGEVDMTMELFTTSITWLLFLVGVIFLGKEFAVKTLLSSAVFTITLPVVTYCSEVGFNGFFDITTYTSMAGERDYALAIISAVFAGVVIGFGCALTFRGGGSSGGFDVIALIIEKHVRGAKKSVLVFIFDAGVVLFGAFALEDLVMTLLGVTSAFVNALVIDKCFIGEKRAFIANIISDKSEEIRNKIIEKIDRTCTIINAVGGFTGEEREMIMVSFTMPEYANLITIIKSVDKNAFVTIHRAHEIDGEGFTKYEVKVPKE